jgi:hypothetical protein
MFERACARMMRRLFVLYVLLVLSVASARAATLEESAKAEGEVVLYSSLNNEQIVTLVDAFKKKYPFTKPSFYRGTSDESCSARPPRPKPDGSRWTSSLRRDFNCN